MRKLSLARSEPLEGAAERCLLTIEAVDIEALVRSVRIRLEASARRAGIEIVVLTSRLEEIPMVAADRRLLDQALMSLGSNAIEYNRLNGKVRIRISQLGPRRVRVAITDTGVGICPDQQARLFARAPALPARSWTERACGGLAMTKSWVEQMGGELGLWSELGAGSTFWIDLPSHDR